MNALLRPVPSLGALIAVVLASASGGSLGEASANSLLSEYPALRESLGWHQHSQTQGTILLATQFPDGHAGSGTTCQVRLDGWVSVFQFSTLGASRTGHALIPTNAIRQLTQILERLPDEQERPTLSNLLLVSYRYKTNWLTKTYDMTHLPQEIKDAFDASGIRFKYDITNVPKEVRDAVQRGEITLEEVLRGSGLSLTNESHHMFILQPVTNAPNVSVESQPNQSLERTRDPAGQRR